MCKGIYMTTAETDVAVLLGLVAANRQGEYRTLKPEEVKLLETYLLKVREELRLEREAK